MATSSDEAMGELGGKFYYDRNSINAKVWHYLEQHKAVDPDDVVDSPPPEQYIEDANYGEFKDSDYDEEESEDDEASTPTLKLRDYQVELSETALEGKNTIICAPTGSGKTRVATHIILEHLKLSNESKEKKVAFLARTVPLAMQQYKSLCKYLPMQYKITNLTGQSTDSMSLHLLLPHNDIVVMTPMILENHIKRGCLPHLGVFSLLVFDECHHTRKGEPYNTLMLSYLKTKVDNPEGIRLPQVVGLTASIGIDKAATVVEAKDNILKVCGNLDVDTISSVERNKEELRKIVPVPTEEMLQLKEREGDECVKKVHIVMKKLEEFVFHHAKELDNKAISDLISKIPNNKKSQEYAQWAVKLKQVARDMPIPDASRETNISVRSLIILSEYLAAYSVALETHDLVELSDVMAYLDKCFDVHRQNEKKCTGETTFFEYFEGLRKLVTRRRGDSNPNLHILASTLKKNLVEKGNNSRGIIFVRTRALTEAVAAWLNRCVYPELEALKAAPFTGTNVSEEQGGMSQAQQEAIIDKFRCGDIRLLVATSVAEEGLDIPECNLVIKYNHVGNEVTTVQTRGRSRAMGGQSILLAMSSVLRREQINRQRALMMEEAVKLIMAMDPEERKKFITDYQKRIIEEGKIMELADAAHKRSLKDIQFQMVCSLCRKVCVESKKVKTIYGKYRISVDKYLMDKIKVKPNKKPEYMDDIEFEGSVYCMGEPEPGKICYQKLGNMIRFSGISFIAVGIAKFGFRIGAEENLKHFKQWKKVPYAVEEVTADDIREYLDSIPEPTDKENQMNTGKRTNPDENETAEGNHNVSKKIHSADKKGPGGMTDQAVRAGDGPNGKAESMDAVFKSPNDPPINLGMSELNNGEAGNTSSSVRKEAPSIGEDPAMKDDEMYEPSLSESEASSISSRTQSNNPREADPLAALEESSALSVVSSYKPPPSEASTGSIQISEKTDGDDSSTAS